MTPDSTRIIHRSDLPLGGFAGIVETRMVMSPRLWKEAKGRPEISHGLGDFVYLASGFIKADEGAPLYPHKDIDIVSFIPNGTVGHEGTMGHGTSIHGPGVQVQRAGTGIKHAEFSLNAEKADLAQLWFLPPENGLEPGYQDFALEKGQMTTVLGGRGDTFDNEITCRIGLLEPGGTVAARHRFVAFISDGEATANGMRVGAGDIIEGAALELSTNTGCNLVLI